MNHTSLGLIPNFFGWFTKVGHWHNLTMEESEESEESLGLNDFINDRKWTCSDVMKQELKMFYLGKFKKSISLQRRSLLYRGFGNHLNILVDVVFYFTGFGHSQFFRGLFFLLLYISRVWFFSAYYFNQHTTIFKMIKWEWWKVKNVIIKIFRTTCYQWRTSQNC